METATARKETLPQPGNSSGYERRINAMLDSISKKQSLSHISVSSIVASEESLFLKLAKKNRNQAQQNRLSDYKNEACCKKKNRSTLNKESIRNIKKLRRHLRGFLLENNYHATIVL